MAQSSSTKTITYIIAILTLVAIAYISWDSWFKKTPVETINPTITNSTSEKSEKDQKVIQNLIPQLDSKQTDITPEEEAKSLGMTTEFTDPRGLVDQLSEQLSKAKTNDDIEKIAQLLGNGQINKEHYQQLLKLHAENRLKLDNETAIQLLGELRAGNKSRWSIQLQDGSKVQLDIAKAKTGKWAVDDVKIPQTNLNQDGTTLTPEAVKLKQLQAEQKDAMNYTHNFMTVLTALDFEKARSMVNTDKISDAKIAGLCILFEDGNYQINQERPLQAIRIREDISAFYANVVSNNSDTKQGAQFSITTTRATKNDPWTVEEINLDKLLEDYAKRVAGGDVHYTPMIKNPNGGETLVIYFEFDSEGLTDRTQKQLNIVARLLKLDQRKKVTLSGHTDAKGSSDYNLGLSKERAKAVMDYLREIGVNENQIVTESHGFSKPRRQESKEDGSDDPSARRANRRTEIYLDF